MFNSISNWWHRKELALQEQVWELRAELAAAKDWGHAQGNAVAQLTLQKAEIDSQWSATLEELEAVRDANKRKLEGEEPWLKVETSRYDKVKGLEVELDWNEALIQYLREAWEGPKDDRVMVQKYIAMLYEHLIERLEAQIIDDSQGRGGEFE